MTKAVFAATLILVFAGTFTVAMPAQSFAQVTGGDGATVATDGGGGGGGGFGGGSGGSGAHGGANGGNGTGGQGLGQGGGGAGVGGGGGGDNAGSPGSGTINVLTNTGTIQGGAATFAGGGGGAGIGGGGGAGAGGNSGGAAGFTITSSTIINSGIIAGGDGGTDIGEDGSGGGAGIGSGGNGFRGGAIGGGDNAGGAGLNGLTIINSGTIEGGNGGAGTDSAGAGGAGIDGSGLTVTNSGTISGGFADGGSGTQADAIEFTGGANEISLSGAWHLNGGIALDTTSTNVTFVQSSAVTLANTISGLGAIVQDGPGTLTLTGANTYSGATTVNGGTLEVTGSITSSDVTVNNGGTLDVTGSVFDPTINSGGTLTGTGSVGATTVNSGGIFAPGDGTPGSSETINGNLTLASGSTYQIYLNPTTSSLANVSGTAALGGTVQANFASGSYISKTYTILTSAGGLNGTTFSGVTNVDLPANFTDSLSYDANDAYLNLVLNYVPPSAPTYTALNRNQQNVATALVNSFNTNGGIPTKFGALPGAALSQIDGEGNTGAEHAAFQLEGQFLNVMLDPFVDGRAGGGGEGFSASAAGTQGRESGMLAYADGQTLPILKGPPPAPIYTPRWSAWGAAYGGVSNTDGNAATGSNRLNANTFGFAGGMDYHVSPETLFGFALAGGGTNWNLASVSGSGRSTALQAGVYAITHAGPLYGAADFGFTNNWFDTDRTALGDQLQANFGGQSYGGRLEGGYHLSNLPIGVTPYAAVQAQEFVTPGYSENDITGGGFGLSYNAMSASDVRTEIGSRFEEVTSLDNMPLALRGKLAWAHDFVSNPSLSTAFESLPGTSFIVNGAPIPHNSALVSGGGELFRAPHWSVLAKFDGEFAGNSQTYGGTGTLQYPW